MTANLHALSPKQFTNAQPLFHELSQQHLFCAGVLAGNYPGQVIVDDPEQPRSGMVFKGGVWCYLGGDANNQPFVHALSQALTAKQFVGEGTWGLLFNVSSTEWHTVLNDLIPDRRPIATPRYLYIASANHFNGPSPIPEGYILHFIDQSLPAKVKGDLPDDVQNVLNLRANSEDPDQAAFGYAILHDKTCVSWAMVDCIVGTQGEIGLETILPYQRRGLAMSVSGATIKYGLAQGLTAIHWDVVSYNVASVHMAEKHGLILHHTYDQNLLIYDQMSYLVNLAWDHLDKNEFEATLNSCTPLFDLEKGRKYGHFLSGAAWAGLGEPGKALAHLQQALDHGWDSLGELESCAPLQILKDTSEWEAIVTRLQTNTLQ